MGVEVLIQHHPARAELLPALLDRLPGARPVADPKPDAALKSPWRTYRACLLAPGDASHRLIVQDDVEVCDHFLEAVERAVEARPDDAIVLYVSAAPLSILRSMKDACARDEPFAVVPDRSWIPAVAVVWPTGMLRRIVEFADAQPWPESFVADDEILGRCRDALFLPVVATVPSLVEHPDVVASVVSKRRNLAGIDRSRVAWCFVDGDPRAIDWSTGSRER